MIEAMTERLIGRYVADDVIDPNTGEVLVTRDKMMDDADAAKIAAAGISPSEDPVHPQL